MRSRKHPADTTSTTGCFFGAWPANANSEPEMAKNNNRHGAKKGKPPEPKQPHPLKPAPPAPPPPRPPFRFWTTSKSAIAFFSAFIGLIGGIVAILGGPVWPTYPEVSTVGADPGSPFSLPFSVKNRSAFFSMEITEIACAYDRMTGPHLHFSDSEQTASHHATIRPGGVFNFRCAVTNPVPDIITEASVRLLVRYTFPWSSRPRCQSNPLDWAKTTDGGRWVMGSTDDAC
jgi:hypothetical protein